MKFIPVFVVLLCQYNAENIQTPFCNHCRCLRRDSEVDVNCTDRGIGIEIILDEKNWNTAGGEPYAISKAIFKDCDLNLLGGRFPKSQLKLLDFSNNFVDTIENGYFYDLQNMTELVLSYNRISRLEPEVFGGPRLDGRDYPLRSLQTLRLDNNRIHSLDADIFRHVETTLALLDLSYNPLKNIDQQTHIAITSLQLLEELRLAHTEIKQLPSTFLHTPKHLKILDLSGNGFQKVPRGLNDSHGLELLYFNDQSRIVNLTEENGFPVVQTLKILHMCRMNNLQRIEKQALSGLENIEELYIVENQNLNFIDANSLTRVEVETQIWPALKKLDLSKNALTNIDQPFLLHWSHLQYLNLEDNPWGCECNNQWMLDELWYDFLRINELQAKSLTCGTPEEMLGKTFYEEYKNNKTMRCMDAYGNRPERDAIILVGVLVALLIGIPLILLLIFAYKRHCFGLVDSSPAAFSRQFYSRTKSDEL